MLGDDLGGYVYVREVELSNRFTAARASSSLEEIAEAVITEWFPGGRGEVQLYVEEPCNQSCEFCEYAQNREEPDRVRRLQVVAESRGGFDFFASGAFEALLVASAARPAIAWAITGHDWLAHPRRENILAALEKHPTLTKFVQGPSTALVDSSLRERVLSLPGLEQLRTTLQSADPSEHDAMVGRVGAGRDIQIVIDAARATPVQLAITTVLTRRALASLPDTVRWVAARSLSLSLQAFIPDRGHTTTADTLPPLDEVRRALAAVEDPSAVSQVVGLPICAVPEALRQNLRGAWNSKERVAARFGEPCRACAARPACSGVTESYRELFGDRGLVPESAVVSRKPLPSAQHVLIILPPDFAAPEYVRTQRFPPLGPAVVAACIAPLGYASRAADLVLERSICATPAEAAALDDAATVRAHLAKERSSPDLEHLVERMLVCLDAHRARSSDLIAISIDRGSQVALVALLAVEIKRRWVKRVIVGGVATASLTRLLDDCGAHGPDVVTAASTPQQIASAFATLASLPSKHVGPPIEPITEPVVLIRKGLRKAASMDGWPLPDFGIYDLASYRRDPLAAAFPEVRELHGRVAPRLVLPYFFALECQFACSFCQTGGNQESKAVDLIVRDLATLAERHATTEFMFFNAQSNLIAPALALALTAAKVDLRWSDSYRVRPSGPGDLETMVRGGCASLTVGVESASDRVLQKMVKGHRAEHAGPMLREADALGLMLRVNLLTCFPGETADDFALTREFAREHARLIDDLAPSSFYLTADSPIGRDPERYGIRVRGARALRGETKFRKSPDSLEYDEVDGLSWEERESTLTISEDELRAAWIAGRGERAGIGGLSPPLMLALSRPFTSKSAMYESLLAWRTSRATRTDAEPAQLTTPRAPLRARPIDSSRELAARVDAVFRGDPASMRTEPGTTLHALATAEGCVLFKGVLRAIRVQGRAGVRVSVEEHVLTAGEWPERARAVTRGAELVVVGNRVRVRGGGGRIEEHELPGVELATFVTEPSG